MKYPVPKSYAVALGILIIDQLSKHWILEIAQMPAREHWEIAPFFNLVMVWNRGISFGMLNSLSHPEYVFGAIAVAIAAALTYWLRKATTRLAIAGIGLIIGGAFGNLLDRLRFGAVVDFLDFHVAGYHWPAFNVADAAVCIGATLLVIESMYEKKSR